MMIVFLMQLVTPLDNGVGLKPPMGWNSWNKFGCDIDQNKFKQMADQLLKLNLSKKGYQYVNLDDCWQISRDNQTKKIIVDPRFPSGIKSISSYLHGLGLKIGLYSDAGYKTCAGRPGSLGFQQIDAQTYAQWKQINIISVDYLKYDNCNTDGTSPKIRYPPMRDALNKTQRPIYFSMCQWGVQDPASWATDVGNSWRTTPDINDTWQSFIEILDKQVGLQKYAGPGHWNDPDMLQVGNGGMQINEYQAQFALWALLKAPLLLGNDLRNVSADILQIIGNEQVIAVNQDKLGKQGKRVKYQTSRFGARAVYAGQLQDNSFGVIFFNRQQKNKADMSISITKDLGIKSGSFIQIRDIITHTDIGLFHQDIFRINNLNPRSIKMYKFKVIQQQPNQYLQ